MHMRFDGEIDNDEYYTHVKETFDKLYNHIKNGEREDMRDMMKLSSARRKLFGKRKNI